MERGENVLKKLTVMYIQKGPYSLFNLVQCFKTFLIKK